MLTSHLPAFLGLSVLKHTNLWNLPAAAVDNACSARLAAFHKADANPGQPSNNETTTCLIRLDRSTGILSTTNDLLFTPDPDSWHVRNAASPGNNPPNVWGNPACHRMPCSCAGATIVIVRCVKWSRQQNATRGAINIMD